MSMNRTCYKRKHLCKRLLQYQYGTLLVAGDDNGITLPGLHQIPLLLSSLN